MPLTQIDKTAALVVIDLQKGITGAATVHPAAEIVTRSARLAHAFRARGWPVVLVRVVGPPAGPTRTDAGPPNFILPPDWAELVPELEQQPSDLVISKPRWSAFIGTALDYDLRQRGVTQIFLTGISTSIGVESTARSAHDFGYHVVLVVDAMTDRNLEAHRHSLETVFPRLGETTTTEEALQLLAK